MARVPTGIYLEDEKNLSHEFSVYEVEAIVAHCEMARALIKKDIGKGYEKTDYDRFYNYVSRSAEKTIDIKNKEYLNGLDVVLKASGEKPAPLINQEIALVLKKIFKDVDKENAFSVSNRRRALKTKIDSLKGEINRARELEPKIRREARAKETIKPDVKEGGERLYTPSRSAITAGSKQSGLSSSSEKKKSSETPSPTSSNPTTPERRPEKGKNKPTTSG